VRPRKDVSSSNEGGERPKAKGEKKKKGGFSAIEREQGNIASMKGEVRIIISTSRWGLHGRYGKEWDRVSAFSVCGALSKSEKKKVGKQRIPVRKEEDYCRWSCSSRGGSFLEKGRKGQLRRESPQVGVLPKQE